MTIQNQAGAHEKVLLPPVERGVVQLQSSLPAEWGEKPYMETLWWVVWTDHRCEGGDPKPAPPVKHTGGGVAARRRAAARAGDLAVDDDVTQDERFCGRTGRTGVSVL